MEKQHAKILRILCRAHFRRWAKRNVDDAVGSAGCQFFVCLAEAAFLDGQYTCFGGLSEGDDVLGVIGDVETVRAGGGENSRPVTRCGVESIRVEER